MLAALVRRGYDRPGRGGPVEVSMLEAPAVGPHAPSGQWGRVPLSVRNDREWWRFAEQVLRRPELAGDPGFATNPARVERRERTDELVARALGVLGADEAPARLETAWIVCARLRDVTERAEHIHSWRPGTDGGKWSRRWGRSGRCCRPSPSLPGGDEAWMGAVPALGEHTGSLLRAAGMTDEEIAALRRDGVVA